MPPGRFQRPGPVGLPASRPAPGGSVRADQAVAVGGDRDIQVVADDLGVHIRGDVAWMEDLAVHQPQRRSAAGPDNGVLVRQCVRWAMAQSHASIAVPNPGVFPLAPGCLRDIAWPRGQ